MKSFQELGTSLSPEVALCVRGRHAVGKSEGVYQIATKIFDDFYKSDEWLAIKADEDNGLPDEIRNHSYEDGIPIVERRLSQMTEGDIVGLPFMESNKRTGGKATSFKPCDWLMNAVEFPVMLFLDERNRALEGVKQAVFQLTDSKAFYGEKLHTNTRIIVAENVGEGYEVQQCDPAEVSRCFTITLEPTANEWIEYAKGTCHEFLISFIRENDNHLEYKGLFHPNKKYHDRRAWMKLDKELQNLGLYDDPGRQLFFVCCASAVGVEMGAKFATYVRNIDRSVSAKDIVTDWDKSLKRLRGKSKHVSNESYVTCVGKLGDYLEKHKVEDAHAIEIARFMFDAPPEIRTNLYSHVNKNPKNMWKIHMHVKDLMLATASGNDTHGLKKPDSLNKKKRKTATKKASTDEAAAPTKAPRGGRKKKA